jgi:hypothetical protein
MSYPHPILSMSDAPTIFRDEAKLLSQRWLEPTEGRVQLVTAVSGAGKSTMLAQARAAFEQQGRVAVGRAERATEGTDPLLPFRDVVVALVGDDGKLPCSAKEAGRRLASGAAELMPDIVGTIFPPLGLALKAGMLGGKALRGERGDVTHARSDFVAGLEAFIEALPEEQPLVVAIDDFHWADEPTSDLVLYLARRVERRRFSVTLLARPLEHQAPHVAGTIGELVRLDAIEAIELTPFDANDVAGVLGAMHPDAEVDVRTAQVIAARSRGNPYYVHKWISHLSANGALVASGGMVRVDERAFDALPSGLGPLLDAMLQGLDPTTRDLLDAAAVIGDVFDPAIAAVVAEVPEREALRSLAALERATDWLEPAGDLLRFDHALLRDHLYAELPDRLRRSYHSAAADALFEADASAGVVGAHLAAADRLDDAAPFLLEAADDDLQHGRIRAAADRLRGLNPPSDYADRDRFYLVQMRADLGAGDVPSALEAVERWKAVADALPEEAILQEAEARHLAGEYSAARDLVRALREAGHPQATIRSLHYVRFTDPAAAEAEVDRIDPTAWPDAAKRQLEYVVAANVLLQRDRVDEAHIRLEKLRDAAIEAGNDEQAASAGRRLCDIAMFSGDLDLASSLLRDARNRAELCGSRQRLYLLVSAGELARQAGDLDRATALLAAADQQMAVLGIPLWQAHVSLAAAQTALAGGADPAPYLADAREVYLRHGVPWGRWHCDVTEAIAAGRSLEALVVDARAHGLLTEARWLQDTESPHDHPLLFL